MLVLELLVEMDDKTENKFIRVRGDRTVEFNSADGALILRVNDNAHCPTCSELREFIQENYISKFDKVLIIDKKGNLKPASSCSNWNDEIMID